MLAITADGQKLPPYVVFKRKTMAKEKFPQGIVVQVQENGWMTEDLANDWIKSVWFQRPCALLRQRSMLVLDHRKCGGPIVTREMQPGNHTRRHDRDVAATQCLKLLASLTRWTGVRTISSGIGPMNKAAKRTRLIVKKTR
jgi:hypothetical protein